MTGNSKSVVDFDIEDSKNIWVSPDCGNSSEAGTYEKPFSSVSAALKIVSPGQNIILLPGIYAGDQTIEISGSLKKPVYIAASGGGAVIEGGCWYFYDASDLVVSGLVFRNTPHGAISMIGDCKRNRFHEIDFRDCGTAGKASCTFYFGGCGARFNLVENCSFIRSTGTAGNGFSAQAAVVALMVSDGDSDNPLTNHIFRRNSFCNYDKAIILGTGSIDEFESGHIVEYNKIENCGFEGIVVKCGDVQIRDNLISVCGQAGIAISGGSFSVIENNRVSSSSQGVTVNGTGHSVNGNCFNKCQFSAVTACGSQDDSQAAGNLFIQENTIVNCGAADNGSAVIIEGGASCIIQKNLFYGSARACSFQSHIDGAQSAASMKKSQTIISGNLAWGGSHKLDGVLIDNGEFRKLSDDNFENESGFGAKGWVLSPDTFDKQAGEALNAQENYAEVYVPENEDENGDGEFSAAGNYDSGREDILDAFFPGTLS
ncbi:MAG: right-handed parallel beta-helix repeat-containing protein [Chitinispirillales bacterium]|jgi:parallel beta-helix repeat protein|nr:right-handed parallel beta-helix repeat-containing protein [Chitinispirillales bacterium]